ELAHGADLAQGGDRKLDDWQPQRLHFRQEGAALLQATDCNVVFCAIEMAQSLDKLPLASAVNKAVGEQHETTAGRAFRGRGRRDRDTVSLRRKLVLEPGHNFNCLGALHRQFLAVRPWCDAALPKHLPTELARASA